MEESIVVRDLSKRFRRYGAERPWTLQEAVLRRFKGLRPGEYFWALKDVSFQIGRGKMVGLIGRNGAGKSTLLRLIGGGGRADGGSIRLDGKVGALIELGAGFHPDLTGRENIFINAIISGLTRAETERRFDEIVQFAELEKFLDNQLRTYSTGMQMRLAFSIAIHVDPEILLVDEVLAVGDLSFQQKCLDRIMEIKRKGGTILLVSHDTGLVRRLCDEALWLEAGELAASGPAHLVVDRYVEFIQDETRRRTPAQAGTRRLANGVELRAHENRFGSLEMEITDLQLLRLDGRPASSLASGEGLRIELEYQAPQPVEAPIFGVTIAREDGLSVYDTSTASGGPAVARVQGWGKVALVIERLDLGEGAYFVDAGIYQKDWDYAYDYHWHVYRFQIESGRGEKGILRPPHRWEHRNGPPPA